MIKFPRDQHGLVSDMYNLKPVTREQRQPNTIARKKTDSHPS